jgi:hypothetical protein
MSFAAKKPCCYVSHSKLVYAALVDAEPTNDDDAFNTTSGTLPPTVTVCSRAYNSHSALDLSTVSGPVLLLEGFLMAPLYTSAPLSVGDLVVGPNIHRYQFGAAQDDWGIILKQTKSQRTDESVLDPYDSTVPAHIAQSFHLFRVTRVGPLDAVRATIISNLDGAVDEYTLSQNLEVAEGTLQPNNREVDAGAECRFKRCELRKVTSSFPTMSSSSTCVRKREFTSDRARRLLQEKLRLSTGNCSGDSVSSAQLVAESPMVKELRSANVRLAPSGLGVGHRTHSKAPTLEDLTDL